MNRLVWIDLETTGLDAATDHVLEIGCVITDADLKPLASKSVLVWPNDPRWTMHALQARPAELGLGPGVLDMHEASGLLRDLRQRASYALGGAALVIGGFIEEHAPGATSPLCGSSVHFDRGFLVAKRCTAILSRVHYRNLDVSVLKNLARLWGYPAWEAPKEKSHRALDDLACSIAELEHYRATMMREVPC
jgi:oligoribonuclease